MEIAKSAKLIGIGNEGINKLNSISDVISKNFDVEKIEMNQDVEKEYVRTLLDGVETLFLMYSSEDKKSCDIVKAIGFMASERRVLCIGLNLSQKKHKEELNIDRELLINEENSDELLSLINIMIDSMVDECLINVDLTDIKEVLVSDKGVKYSYSELSNTTSHEEIVKSLMDNMKQSKDEFNAKKSIIFLELGLEQLNEEEMIKLNDLLMLIQENIEGSYEAIYSIYLKEELKDKIKVGLVLN